MNNYVEKKHNKKFLIYFIIGLVILIVAGITLQKGLAKIGFGKMGYSNVGSVYLVNDTLYYGSEWYGICTYNEKTLMDKVIIKNAESLFAIDADYIYYKKSNNNYRYDLSSGKSQRVNVENSANQNLYFTAKDNTDEVEEILRRYDDLSGDAPYATISDNYLYVSHNQDGGYISVYEITKTGKLFNVDKNNGKILKYSYSPFHMFMSNLGKGKSNGLTAPTNLLSSFFPIFFPIFILIIGVIVIRKGIILKK